MPPPPPLLLLLLLPLLLVLVHLPASLSQTPNAEVQTLFDLYTNCNGDNWARNERWNFLGGNATDACLQSWDGIICQEFHVVEINLASNNLVCSQLPSSFGNLGYLTALYLQNNSIQGTFPSALGSLPKLAYVNVAQNSLSGAIPNGQYPMLLYFNGSYNQFVGPVPAFFKAYTTGNSDLRGNNIECPLEAWMFAVTGDCRADRLFIPVVFQLLGWLSLGLVLLTVLLCLCVRCSSNTILLNDPKLPDHTPNLTYNLWFERGSSSSSSSKSGSGSTRKRSNADKASKSAKSRRAEDLFSGAVYERINKSSATTSSSNSNK